MPYAGGMARYRAICNSISNQNYIGFILGDEKKGETYTPPKISVDILAEDVITKRDE